MDLVTLLFYGRWPDQDNEASDVTNRGLISQDGAGLHQGGGTQVFEAIRASGWPAILLPGIHRASKIDPRLRVFSHGMSPEKVGLAYGVFKQKSSSFIVCDASSNTVTFAVLSGEIIGAIDAPIFAPGLLQGPLDVQAIRNVDSGKLTANQAFIGVASSPRWDEEALINACQKSVICHGNLSSSRPWRSVPKWSSAATLVMRILTYSWQEARRRRLLPGYLPSWEEGLCLWRDRLLLRVVPGSQRMYSKARNRSWELPLMRGSLEERKANSSIGMKLSTYGMIIVVLADARLQNKINLLT